MTRDLENMAPSHKHPHKFPGCWSGKNPLEYLYQISAI